MKEMEFILTPRLEDGHLELKKVPLNYGWKNMYAALTFEGNLATSIKSSTGLFDTRGEVNKYLVYLNKHGRKDVWSEAVKIKDNTIKIPRDGDLTLPESEPARTIALKVLDAALITLDKAPYTGGCRTFYTPEEWAEKEEMNCDNMSLIICHDGGDFYEICSYSGTPPLGEIFNKELDKQGYWLEAGTNWWTAVYPNEK